MDIVKDVLEAEENELETYVNDRINDLETESKEENNCREIGYLIDKNYKEEIILSKSDVDKAGYSICYLYSTYIPKGTKMIYGAACDKKGRMRNEGLYYYMDIDDYILEFCKYIRKTGVIDFNDLIDAIHIFIDDYFGSEKEVERDQMLQLILDINDNYFEPIQEHGLSLFKGKGNALCSEVSSIAQNLMTFFGIESYLAIGRVTSSETEAEAHAYNFIVDKEQPLLVDFANGTFVYDINYNIVGTAPYIAPLEEFDEQLIEDLSNYEKKLEFKDYAYMIIGDTMAKLEYNKQREYYLNIDNPFAISKESQKVLTKSK